MRIPNLSKMELSFKDDRDYEERRYNDYYDYDDIGYDLSDDKSKMAFIKYIKTMIRNSFEYKNMIDFLKKYIDMNHCTYFKGINNSIKGIKIEIHHEPFVLEDICYIVLRKFMEEDMEIKPSVISEHVMLLHYMGLIGLIPVSKTVHELIHDKEIFVPITYVYGNIEQFYREYHEYMTKDQKEILRKSIALSEKLENATPKALKKKFVYLDIKGMEFPKEI